MKRMTRHGSFIGLMLLIFLLSCSYQQNFVKHKEIQSRARLVAVLPLINLTSYPNAGRIVGDILSTALYAKTDFVIMERTQMLENLKGKEDDLDLILDKSVALKVGKQLGVDTVIFGSVSEYRYKRGLDENPVVGINIRMLDIKSNKILWAGSESRSGGCFWICEDSLNRVAQKVCNDLVDVMSKSAEK